MNIDLLTQKEKLDFFRGLFAVFLELPVDLSAPLGRFLLHGTNSTTHCVGYLEQLEITFTTWCKAAAANTQTLFKI